MSDEGSPPDATPETCAPLHPYAATTERAPASGSRRSGRLRASMRWLGRRVRQLGQLFARQGRITQTADRESTRPGSQTISTSGNPLAARADNLPTFRALTPGQEDTISAPVVRTRTWTVSQTTKTAARPTVPDVVPAEAAPLLHPGPQPRRHRRSPSGVNPAGLAADPTPTIPEED
ncbi:hypothetical protein CAL14_15210 [Bordetella genomosp. 9]|nr:hypothetical protein CAL14_15210 [Bordetella genomosp. 9]